MEFDRGIETIEMLTGLSVRLIMRREFLERQAALDEVLAATGYQGIDLAYVDFPEASPWLTPYMVGRYTSGASDCVAGVAVNGAGQTKIFHFEYWRTHADWRKAGMYPEEIAAGLFSSGSIDSLGNHFLMNQYSSKGLTQIQLPNWFSDGHFGIMVDYLNNELVYYFQNFDYSLDQPLPPF